KVAHGAAALCARTAKRTGLLRARSKGKRRAMRVGLTAGAASRVAAFDCRGLKALRVRPHRVRRCTALLRAVALMGNLRRDARGAFGNAASGLKVCLAKASACIYAGYEDFDALLPAQARQLDPARCAAMQKIEELIHARAIYAHVWQLAFSNAAGACLNGALRRRDAEGRLAIGGHR